MISMLLALCFLAGCERERNLTPAGGKGDLRLSLSSLQATFDTRAGAAETPQEGYAFHNLLVILTDDHGKVIDKVYREYAGSADAFPQADVVSFEGLEMGVYHAYAYANIDHAAWQQSGATIAAVEKTLPTAKSDGASVQLDLDRTLRSYEAGTAPAMPSATPMLLTGKVTIPISVEDNAADLPLLRPVVRFNVNINNHTPYDLQIQELLFSPFNASQTYLVDHWTEAGRPVIPAAAEYIDLPPLGDPVTVGRASEGEEVDSERIYSTLLYENAAESYKIYMKLTLLNGSASLPVRILGETRRSVSLLSPSDILAMQPGDTPRTVLLVNPQYNGNGVIVGWDGTDFVFRKAPSIKAVADYYAWLSNIVLGDDMDPYFLRLERQSTDGPYGLYSGDHNLFENLDYLTKNQQSHRPTGASGMEAVSVAVVDPKKTWNQIDSGFYPYLMRFRCKTSETENYDAYLWNHNQTALRTYADASNQARQWVLYEVSSVQDGVVMNYVDKTTHKTRPLTQMNRNQEYDVNINVYYVEFETQFDFRVENTWWTDSGGHVSEHYFE